MTHDGTPALEKMSYATFQRHYTTYRQSTIPHLLIDLNDAKLELPDRSSLHTIRNFLTLDLAEDGITPDLDNPFYQHETWRKFLHIETAIATADSRPYPVTDRFTYMPGRFRGVIQHFFGKNRDFHNTLDDASVDKASNILACHEYAPLLSARVQGSLSHYRKFEIVMRSILNKILSTKFARHHYIQIPLSDILYTRGSFNRVIHQINTSTIKDSTDPSFFFLAHLVGFLINEFSPETPTKLLPNDVGYLSENDESIAKTNSLFNRIEYHTLDAINIIFTHGGKGIIYNLGDLKAYTSSMAFVDKVLRHVNLLKMVSLSDNNADALAQLDDDKFRELVVAKQGNTVVEASDDEKSTDIQNAAVTSNDSVTPDADNTTIITTTPTPAKPSAFAPPPATTTPAAPPTPHQFVQTVHKELAEAVTAAQSQTTGSADSIKRRADTLVDKHMQVKLAGKTIAEHLATPDPSIEDGHLDFIADSLPDRSMAQSSIANMDQLYVRHVLSKDLAKTLTSFVRQGYFVSDLKENLEVDQFNRKTHYKVKLLDVEGKAHSLNFTLPHVDEHGYMLINGVVSRMVKQNVNLPICKIGPDRVNLSSTFNKTLVERIGNRANNYSVWVNKYLTILIRANLLTVVYGKLKVGARVLPYEYSCIAQRYTGLTFKGYRFNLDYDHRMDGYDANQVHAINTMELKYGTFAGRGPDFSYLYWDMADVIHEIGRDGKVVRNFHFMPLCNHLFSADGITHPPMISEWTELKILNLTIPIIFVLGYRYGLTKTLKYINLNYTVYPKGKRIPLKADQIAVHFADSVLVFSRYPFAKSLIASGLNKWDLSSFAMVEFDAPDAYATLFEKRGISINYLEGITAFFDFFIDPVMMDLLQMMHEPTNSRDLLLRATEMLSTIEHHQPSSMRNHRLRGYERLASTLYNEASRELASYRKRRNQRSGFSIKPDVVLARIMSDATVMNAEILNPIGELKGKAHLTHTGAGGRTSQSFVVQDRVYADDSVGVISEATPDSGKVAMTAYTSANPRMDNLRGMVSVNDEGTKLAPSQILSVNAMLIPGITQDDSKRASFSSIQSSHVTPCPNYEVAHVRTGYEKVIAHRVSDDFASAAQQDGKVVGIDEKLGLLTIQYDPTPVKTDGVLTLPMSQASLAAKVAGGTTIKIVVGGDEVANYPLGKVFSLGNAANGLVIGLEEHLEVGNVDPTLMKTRPDLIRKLQNRTLSELAVVTIKLQAKSIPGTKTVLRYGSRYTPVSGSAMQQDLVLNVHEGETFKRGDILVYNKGFFEPEAGSRQVNWKHGIMATVALIEKSETLEDGSIVSKSLGERMVMSPAHTRPVTLTNRTVIKQIVNVGDHVETVDPLCTFIEDDLDALVNSAGEDTLSFLTSLEKKAPRARYHGKIADINIYYAGDISTLTPSLQDIVRQVDRRHRALSNAMKGTAKEGMYHHTTQVPLGMKYRGVEFDEGTVLLEFLIAETLPAGSGDKCVIGAANKTVISSVMEEQYYTQSGLPIDAMYGCASAAARIVNSIYVMGIGNRVARALQDKVVGDYFS